ncbi:MAG: substrate-binding domain-containing protein [Candidatus Odinarchaeum yellowstonii]|uniref:Substrate-binding domain-containing protein n=1 Tax=Odinarchaeota yellowstonii (strain LCB_4) TaxID=1841599 RepID=A0AAF0D3A3_ODILC|nr:MAG: substrate-binding domain-containing protein [Candidatus Odinarchaeum yellowstonii]
MAGKKPLLVALIIITVSAAAGLTALDYIQIQQRLIVATTTSLYETGLLTYLIPSFEVRWNVKVHLIAVGTGQAIALGRDGDCDLVLVHARNLEDEFIQQGYGLHRVTLWYNDFIIIGPENDPANITGLTNVTEAFIRIYSAGEMGRCNFYSRGDSSGTEEREKQIWLNTGLLTPDPNVNKWYKRTGQGMSETLIITNEDPAGYTITDRGSYVNLINRISLKILVENSTLLLNPYSAILVNPEINQRVNIQLAVKFIAYLCWSETQKMVDEYKKNKIQLFHSCYGKSNSTDLGFDTDEQVAESLAYWDPIIKAYYS